MTNLDSILKSRDMTLPTKVRLVKAMVFPVVMYGCESWTVKKAERQRIDAFELWCWRRRLRVPWTARRSALGFLWREWCWSWNSSTLATSREELTHWKRLWCWEGLWAGGEGDDRGWDGWMASLTRWMWVWVNSRSWWWTGRPGVLRFMGSQRVGHDWAAELNWTNWWEASDFVSSVSLETHSFLCPLNWIWVLDVILRLSWFTHLKRSLPVLVYRTQISCEVPAALFYLEKVLMSCHWNLKMTKMVHLL